MTSQATQAPGIGAQQATQTLTIGRGLLTDLLDKVRVPSITQEVTFIGEGQCSTSLAREDHLHTSGGAKQKADEKRIYIVRANGSFESGSVGRWFGRSTRSIQSGESIVVPLDAERLRALPLWTANTMIMFDLAVAVAVAVAAVNSF